MWQRALSGSGGGGDITSITQDETPSSSPTSKTYTLEVGKVYLLLIWGDNTTPLSKTRYDNITATGATITKVGNLFNTNSYAAGTFFNLVPTQTNVTINSSVAGVFILFTPE
jgi:hypothetical protein